MGQLNVQDRLKMQPVKMEHVGQFNDLLRYVFQVTNQELQEVGFEEEELEQAKRPVLEKADVLGWFDREKLISQLAVYPMEINVHGVRYKMGGLTGVGTYPEYANLGLMHQLMRRSLKDMRERGQSVSYLFPYSIPYYRRKGWEIISDKMTFTIKDTQFPNIVPVSGMVERTNYDDPDVLLTYRQFANKRHGTLIRDELSWEEYFRWEKEELVAGVYYNERHEPEGYLFYWIADDVFHMKEMIYLTQEARHGLWNFVTAHYSMVTEVKGRTYTNEPIAFLLEDSEIVETIQPYYMARIVDVVRFLSQYPFLVRPGEKNFHFVVEDPLLEWNQGIFGLEFVDGQVKMLKEPIGPAVVLNIQTLTTMFFSYKRPRYLAKIGRVQADSDVIRQLEDLIPAEAPYFSDYF
ncbi:GNAT family N-acetyltransferase [Listeria ilorinensis]|uniref:GNAT family N-acetyltransferase n=1 Tax=Listeria ilorinensis TaxID=2867439 RepID=UPI001EF4EC31|nr:GNAT family N-acetyltransferase [Listeria ilorinensis]